MTRCAVSIARRSDNGTSLIEIMVSVIILTIVLLSSAQLFTAPPVMKEACHHAAVFKAMGLLNQVGTLCFTNYGDYMFDETNGAFSSASSSAQLVVEPTAPAIPYVLSVTSFVSGSVTGMMATIRLYEDQHAITNNNAFARLSILVPP